MTGCFASRKLFLVAKCMHDVQLCEGACFCQLSFIELQQGFGEGKNTKRERFCCMNCFELLLLR